jgi:hypothetical protein
MSMETVVDRLGARRTSPGRFIAKCPAHPDSSPSLAISSGRDGRVLMRCFGGCSLAAVLTSSGLTLSDLFAGPPPTREQLIAAETERAQADAARRQRAQAEREYIDRLREGYRERESALTRVARKVALMDDSQENSISTELLHDRIAEVRSFDRAIVNDPDDYLPMEKPVPPKPYRLEAR